MRDVSLASWDRARPVTCGTLRVAVWAVVKCLASGQAFVRAYWLHPHLHPGATLVALLGLILSVG